MTSNTTRRTVAGLALAAGLGIGGTAIAHAETTTTTDATTTSASTAASTSAPATTATTAAASTTTPTTAAATTTAPSTTATTAATGSATPGPTPDKAPPAPGRHVDGTIASIDATSVVITKRDGSTVTIGIDGSTVLKADKDTAATIGDFAAGQNVHVDLVDPSATPLVAAKIEKAPAGPGGPAGPDKGPDKGPGAHVDGVVDSADASGLVVRRPDGTTTSVGLTASTTYRFDKDADATAADLTKGQRVHVDVVDPAATDLVAASVEIKLPHLDGTVTDVSGTTITITDHDGFRRTIHTADATVYTSKGADATAAAVVAGADVHATGKVDANGTDLDATRIEIR